MPNMAEAMQGRVPVIVRNRDIYLGAPNWWHDDAYEHHGLDRSFEDSLGYFGGGKKWNNGRFTWLGHPPFEDGDIRQTLQREGILHPSQAEAMPEGPLPDIDWDDMDDWG